MYLSPSLSSGKVLGYGQDVDPGVKALIENPQFFSAAKDLYGKDVLIEPQMMFCNLFIPGEAQGIHTDVPEFRGCNRTNTPEWMLVCMLHSNLFNKWRLRIATAISWFSKHSGGELAFYPKPFSNPGEAVAHPTKFNTSIILDTDSVYHGVDPVGGPNTAPPVIPEGSKLIHTGNGRWKVAAPTGESLPTYEDMGWDEIRMSVQWKAFIFEDHAAKAAWRDHTDDLSPAVALDMLVKEFYHASTSAVFEPKDLGKLVEAVCVHFIKTPFEISKPHSASKL
jgi:hypothetical protein